ncbi:unnamed protein product [Staurois parvus]|uniref:Uncharacterized protein n=1 Tax=Staurois parvus TaxID=386267 RepID=A0ABN9D2V0_9NEOB|nr:unnamed protein product [Staurois parvus]
MLPSSAANLCQSVLHISAASQYPSQCPSVLPISAHQCHLSVFIIVPYQCRISVPPHQCSPMLPHQCRLPVSISAASSVH